MRLKKVWLKLKRTHIFFINTIGYMIKILASGSQKTTSIHLRPSHFDLAYNKPMQLEKKEEEEGISSSVYIQ